MNASDPLTQATEASEHQPRLFDGMARAVAAKGYGAITIADIVREAGVSRRTFYEHFTTKADCLIALYASASRNALNALRSSLDPNRTWQTQVEVAMVAYLNCLENNPLVMRTLFVEILGLGAGFGGTQAGEPGDCRLHVQGHQRLRGPRRAGP